MEFGQKLRKLRIDKGLTQDEVAKACGMTRRAYISYEQNNVRPRNRETYTKLATILDSDVNYLILDDNSVLESTAAMAATVGAMGMPPVFAIPLVMAGGFVSILKKYNQNVEKESIDGDISDADVLIHSYEKIRKKFKSAATGIIMTTLAFKGVQCQLGKINDLDYLVNTPELVLLLNDHPIHNWWFIFWTKDCYINDQQMFKPRELADILISRFTGIPSDSTRKVSIVVDDEELFNAICCFKNNNSYRGNLSVILIDIDESKVSKEEIISTFNDEYMCELSLLDN